MELPKTLVFALSVVYQSESKRLNKTNFAFFKAIFNDNENLLETVNNTIKKSPTSTKF